MDKIICDVCGTSYSESAEQCPICLRARAGGAKTVADDIVLNEAQPTGSSSGGTKVRGGRFSKSNVRKRNRNMPIYDMPEEKPRTKANPEPDADDPYDFAEETPRRKTNTVLNVLLVIVIVALLCVTGYIFTQYFLPGILSQTNETVPATVATVPPTTEAPTEPPVTEEPTIPCTGLEWSDGEDFVLLEGLGESWMLNVLVTPDDTTDELAYYSSDETVVTVDSEGCVTAVGEGEAIVVVSCGGVELQCEVVCVFVTEDPMEEGTEETTGQGAEETEEEPTEPLKDVKLEVNFTDITLTGYGQQFTFKVTDLTNEECTWTSDNEKVVTVEDGTVTRVGKGTANITVKYGDQEVVIIVRCR